MNRYVVRRILMSVPTFILTVLFVFMIIRLIPGDPVEIILSQSPYTTQEAKDSLRAYYGLDKPLYEQFVNYLGQLVTGDLGESTNTESPVTEELRSRLPITMEFGVFAVVIGLIVAIPIGVLSAIRQDSWSDYLSRSFAIFGISVPYFFTALLLIIYPIMWFGWAPPLRWVGPTEDPIGHIHYMFWPALLLGVTLAGSVLRMTRNQMLEVLRQDYIRTAYSKGLRERVVIWRHALRNALIPVITILGLQVGIAVSGTVVLEVLFNMPGLGKFFLQGIFNRDYPAIQGTVLVIASFTLLVNLFVDLCYAWIDPRIKYS
ncbi:MAG: ABC transporter permease [Dehalococcoidia bacterium]|nr:ABC transporter permease [Dehalococcoidia bacterium]